MPRFEISQNLPVTNFDKSSNQITALAKEEISNGDFGYDMKSEMISGLTPIPINKSAQGETPNETNHDKRILTGKKGLITEIGESYQLQGSEVSTHNRIFKGFRLDLAQPTEKSNSGEDSKDPSQEQKVRPGKSNLTSDGSSNAPVVPIFGKSPFPLMGMFKLSDETSLNNVIDPMDGLESQTSERIMTKEDYIEEMNLKTLSNKDNLQIKSMLGPSEMQKNMVLSGYKTRGCEYTQSN